LQYLRADHQAQVSLRGTWGGVTGARIGVARHAPASACSGGPASLVAPTLSIGPRSPSEKHRVRNTTPPGYSFSESAVGDVTVLGVLNSPFPGAAARGSGPPLRPTASPPPADCPPGLRRRPSPYRPSPYRSSPIRPPTAWSARRRRCGGGFWPGGNGTAGVARSTSPGCSPPAAAGRLRGSPWRAWARGWPR
jgi:hypothetical protein